MVLSMTGFGSGSSVLGDAHISVEIRSVNSKTLDLRIKTPIDLKEQELELRQLVGQTAGRGKVDITIRIESSLEVGSYSIDETAFKYYFNKIKELSSALGFDPQDQYQNILRLPSVVKMNETDIDEDQWKCILLATNEAILKYNQFREKEGEYLAKEMKERILVIAGLNTQILPMEQERAERVRSKLATLLNEYLAKERIDENRFEQEILFYLEKIDISEEKLRLEKHCHYFIEQMEADDPLTGRQLNFISQEIGREINTLGAKAYHSEIQRIVVQMKDELEKIKEQLANIA
jgi:uncharacterized protein (TIGR00255 family)